jgi:predicted ester cyclase
MDSTAKVQEIIRSYYAVFDAKTGNPATLDAILSPTWKNHSSDSAAADRPAFIGLLSGLQQAVPDMQWRISEVLLAGDRVVVRGEGSGTPAGDFFGVPHTGKAFSIMSIDIHTIRDGRIQKTYHLEDWAGALRQLTGQ